MSQTKTQNPYASPEAESRDSDPLAAELLDLPTRSSRLSAAVIDFILVDIPATFAAVFTRPIVERLCLPLDEAGNQVESTVADLPFMITPVVTTLAVYLLVEGYLVATRGQTIGKSAMDMKIVRRDGRPAGFMRLVFVRYFPWLLFFYTQLLALDLPLVGIWILVRVGLVSIWLDPLFLFTKEKRCLHDYLAGTIVIKTGADEPT